MNKNFDTFWLVLDLVIDCGNRCLLSDYMISGDLSTIWIIGGDGRFTIPFLEIIALLNHYRLFVMCE